MDSCYTHSLIKPSKLTIYPQLQIAETGIHLIQLYAYYIIILPKKKQICVERWCYNRDAVLSLHTRFKPGIRSHVSKSHAENKTTEFHQLSEECELPTFPFLHLNSCFQVHTVFSDEACHCVPIKAYLRYNFINRLHKETTQNITLAANWITRPHAHEKQRQKDIKFWHNFDKMKSMTWYTEITVGTFTHIHR